MPGVHLHKFDLGLCEYLLGNVRQYLDDPEFADWVRGCLPPALVEYLWANLGEDDPAWLLLDDAELDALATIAECPPPGLDREWVAYEQLHGRHLDSVREVRDELAPQVAEEWSRACADFARRLEVRRRYLDKGIEVVREWLPYLRRLLKAMHATHFLPYPEGRSPTPTNPTPPPEAGESPPPPISDTDPRLGEAVERMRIAIKERADGRDASPRALIKSAQIANTLGRDALRILEASGEYRGFGRDRAVRYKQGRPHER